ncbi:MAG: MarR family transcriptional regulator [Clostridiales bacterium]|nr:MarR family transcriptional regulator [Clostridiales bacterium]
MVRVSVEETIESLLGIDPILHKKLLPQMKGCFLKLNHKQFHILLILNGTQSLNMSALAEKVGCSNQQLTKLVNEIEKLSLVKRRIDNANRRNVLVALTEKGKKFLSDCKKKLLDAITPKFENFSDDEINALYNAAETIKNILGKH